jgi:hypothetical protein
VTHSIPTPAAKFVIEGRFTDKTIPSRWLMETPFGLRWKGSITKATWFGTREDAEEFVRFHELRNDLHIEIIESLTPSIPLPHLSNTEKSR